MVQSKWFSRALLAALLAAVLALVVGCSQRQPASAPLSVMTTASTSALMTTEACTAGAQAVQAPSPICTWGGVCETLIGQLLCSCADGALYPQRVLGSPRRSR